MLIIVSIYSGIVEMIDGWVTWQPQLTTAGLGPASGDAINLQVMG